MYTRSPWMLRWMGQNTQIGSSNEDLILKLILTSRMKWRSRRKRQFGCLESGIYTHRVDDRDFNRHDLAWYRGSAIPKIVCSGRGKPR